MRRIVALLLMLTLAGCASMELKIPVTGKMVGQDASGTVFLRPGGESRVVVETVKGLRCEAPVSASEFGPTQRAAVTCNDGRTGEMVTQREAPGNGTATASFTDGTRAQFVWGNNMRYEDSFPGPDATAPVPKPAVPVPSRQRR